MAVDRAPSRAARAAAALWLARLHRDPPAADDADAFRAWLAEHPDHRRAFDDATRTWDSAGGLRDLDLARPTSSAPSIGRRRLFEAVAATVLLGAGFGAWRSATAGVYETGLGEQRRVTLEDGSDLLLDTDTRIRVRIDPETRRVDLARGRVNCRVADDPIRPFVVDAGGQQVVASGSVMDVRRDAEQVSVICLQGSADVVAAPAMPAQHLAVGQRLNASASRPATVDRPELAPLVAWQNGQAIFDNVTLADAIREMNRYGRTRLELADPRLAGLRISGTYHVGNPVAFAQSAATLLPVRVEPSGDSIRLVPDPGRNFLPRG
jgi:transmembrane sensor